MIYPGYLHRINSIFSLLPLLRVRRSQDRFPFKEFEIKTRIRGDKGRDFSDFLIEGILQILVPVQLRMEIICRVKL